MRLTIFTDGACKGNPGPAAIGAVLFDSQNAILLEISKAIGNSTNNKAEYRAIIEALTAAKRLKADEVVVYLDSELVVKQLTRQYKVRSSEILPLYLVAADLLQSFPKNSVKHIGRSLNQRADALANKAFE